MAHHQRGRRQPTRLPRAESDILDSSGNDSGPPQTIFVTVTVTASSQAQQLTTPLTPSYHTSIFSNSSHISSASSSRRLLTSSYPHVPSETEVPERWHPKYLDGETNGKITFLGWAAAIIIFGVLCLMSVTAWNRVWRGKPRKIPTDEDEAREEEEEERRIQRKIREILERFRRT